MSMTGLPPFNTAGPAQALGYVPGAIWENLPSAFVFGLIDVGSTYLHKFFEDKGYNGVLPFAFANGLGDTAKFSYYQMGGMTVSGSAAK
jgi:hypothetical protein